MNETHLDIWENICFCFEDFQNAFLSYVKKSETKAENSTSTSDNDNISESSVENPSSGGKSDSLQSGEAGAEEASTTIATPTVETRASALKDESVSVCFVYIVARLRTMMAWSFKYFTSTTRANSVRYKSESIGYL